MNNLQRAHLIAKTLKEMRAGAHDEAFFTVKAMQSQCEDLIDLIEKK